MISAHKEEATGVSNRQERRSCEPVILIHIDFSSLSLQTSFNGTKDPMSPEAAANREGAVWMRCYSDHERFTKEINIA